MKSKLKPENRDDARVLADSGEVDDIDAVDGDGDDGPNAVFRRRRELLGWSGWSRDGAILIRRASFVIGDSQMRTASSSSCEVVGKI